MLHFECIDIELLTRPAYPKLADCCERMVVNLSVKSMVNARRFVEFGLGSNDGSVPIVAFVSS